MEKKALLVIDMQADYIGEKNRYGFYSPALIDKINERTAIAQKDGELIIYIRNKGRRNKEPYVGQFTEKLNIISDNVIDKEKQSAFSNDKLQEMLVENDIDRIEVIGIDGNCCVAATAIDAALMGMKVLFPLEYIGIKSMDRYERRTKEKLAKAGVRVLE